MKTERSPRTVFILGAGASRSAGAPLMADFIERALSVYSRGTSGWARKYFEQVFVARRKLQAAFAKSNVDLDNIENLFSVFEMASLIGRLDDLPEEAVNELPRSLRFLISRTLEQTIQYPMPDSGSVVRAPFPYDAFAQLLIELNTMSDVGPVAVMTFNYDLCLEYALALEGVAPNYGFDAPAGAALPIYKVHGSLNWVRDDLSGAIRWAGLRPPPIRPLWEKFGLNASAARPVDTADLLDSEIRSGSLDHPDPVIVPPTWNKGAHQQMLRHIWRQTSVALASAENIFVIGYSLPPSDQFFRAFFSLSTIADTIIDRFWVFDPAPTEFVKQRYGQLLGPAIRDRNKFIHEPLKFSGAIRRIAETFNLEVEELEDR
jgi:hypothetical protein